MVLPTKGSPMANRNFQDQIGYGSTPADERLGLLAGLLGGALVIVCAMIGAAL